MWEEWRRRIAIEKKTKDYCREKGEMGTGRRGWEGRRGRGGKGL
jgi:hypothetical protein